MLKLNPSRSALVLIDLQKGILPFAGGPHSAADVVKRAAELAQGFRDANAPVFLVRVGWSADFADALKQPVDSASGGTLPANWWDIPADLRAQDSDIRIIKRQWGAFYGTELEMQLRRRGIETIVLGGGISTNIGVEFTARNAWELGFELVLVEDICSAHDKAQHDGSFQHIFPRLGRVRHNAQVLAALTG